MNLTYRECEGLIEYNFRGLISHESAKVTMLEDILERLERIEKLIQENTPATR